MSQEQQRILGMELEIEGLHKRIAELEERQVMENEKFASVLVSDLLKSNEETLRLRARIAELEEIEPIGARIKAQQRIAELEAKLKDAEGVMNIWRKLLEKG